MSLRGSRAPSPKDNADSFEYDAKLSTISEERKLQKGQWTPAMTSLMTRTIGLLILSSVVLGICYSFLSLNNTNIPSSTSNVRRRQTSNDNGTTEKQCTIYMAPSSLKGLDGYGVFTTRDIRKGSSIFQERHAPSIPVVDENRGPWLKIWNEYLWGRGLSDQIRHLGESAMDFQVGFGSLPNHNCILRSLSHRYPEPGYDDSLVVRGQDPGTGAFSYSMGRDFYARKALTAGDEIFLNYGYCSRGERYGHDWANYIPMKEDYEDAAKIAWAFLQLPQDVNTPITVPNNVNKLVASLLPKSTKHLRDIVGTAKVESPDDLVPLIAKHLAATPRTPDWIRSNGLCLENLVARKSQLPHAGQGGFAQYHIQKGEIIVPAPMIHIVDKESLIIYSDDDSKKPVGWQLLLNYCLGHPESTLLLCPDTNAILVNHCSTRTKQCGRKGPNAEYRWSSGWEPKSDEWRNMTLKEIGKQTGRGLSMEIVALRDIEPNEEVFVNYGMQWESAWENHVKNWNPPEKQQDTLITAKEANEQTSLELLVTGDLRKVSNHPYLFTACHYWPSKEDKSRIYKKEYPNWEQLDDNEILHLFADSGKNYRGDDFVSHSDKTYWPCSVLYQETSGSSSNEYTVRIHQVDWVKNDLPWHANGVPRLLKHYPREAIQYFVKPYASDQDLPGVFREPIGIRDDLFPEQWKNVGTKQYK